MQLRVLILDAAKLLTDFLTRQFANQKHLPAARLVPSRRLQREHSAKES